jgi:hypothetical protein
VFTHLLDNKPTQLRVLILGLALLGFPTYLLFALAAVLAHLRLEVAGVGVLGIKTISLLVRAFLIRL